MLRICRKCGTGYEGDPGSSLCPSCVRAGKQTTIRDRVCRTCGVTFPGGPRAWYCPGCRAQRQKEASRRNNYKQARGLTRKIGSTDKCVICGGEYTVAAGAQKYCPACAPDAVREIDRAQGRQWHRENVTPADRMALRKAHSGELVCEICGKGYVPTSGAKTCSPACGAARLKRRAQEYERAHREERSRRKRENYHKRKEAKENDG